MQPSLALRRLKKAALFTSLPGTVLAFRELGLSIGLKGAAMLAGLIRENPGNFAAAGVVEQKVDRLAGYLPLAGTIERFWMDERNQEPPAWTEHREINLVMLATSLLPDEFLRISGREKIHGRVRHNSRFPCCHDDGLNIPSSRRYVCLGHVS